LLILTKSFPISENAAKSFNELKLII